MQKKKKLITHGTKHWRKRNDYTVYCVFLPPTILQQPRVLTQKFTKNNNYNKKEEKEKHLEFFLIK